MYKQLEIWDLLQREVPDEEVKINGVVNLKTSPISHYDVRLNYGDLTLLIAMLRDYVKGLDKMLADGDLLLNEIEYEAYYRNKFLQIADRISEQIEYDYEKQLKKCLKKAAKENTSDVGEEALSLALKRGAKKNDASEKEKLAQENDGQQ